MWDLPGPGIRPVSPEQTGKLLTTGLPGKPLKKKKKTVPGLKLQHEGSSVVACKLLVAAPSSVTRD